MSKNRRKQRINKQTGRYLRALKEHNELIRPETEFCVNAVKRTDECGRKDLTGYNAVMLLENEDWVPAYR